MAPVTRSKSEKQANDSKPPQGTQDGPANHDAPSSAAAVDQAGQSVARRSTRISNRRAAAAAAAEAAAKEAESSSTAAVPPLKPSLRRAVAGRRRAADLDAADPPAAAAKRPRLAPALSGLWDLLPPELVDMVLNAAGPRELARLETTCRYFRETLKLDEICCRRLAEVSRAKDMQPNRSANETWASLLFFITAQSDAAAQATALALGNTHSAALLVPENGPDANHNLYTFGYGHDGELGHGSYRGAFDAPAELCLGYEQCQASDSGLLLEEEITPAVVMCGASHSAAITRRGVLYTFGSSGHGQLGIKDVGVDASAVPVRTYINPKPHHRIVSVACGARHTLAISEFGAVWACGYNVRGQLGVGHRQSCSELTLVSSLRKYRIVASAAGAYHSMALSADGSLFTWGWGADGRLGHMQFAGLQMMQANEQAMVLDRPRRLDALDPLALYPWQRATAISSGQHHCMVVTVGGGLVGFGRNKHGELGLAAGARVWTPTAVPLAWGGDAPEHFRAAQVACGANHTLALVLHRGKPVPCAAGANVFGQLGQGDQCARAAFVPITLLQGADIAALQAGDHNSAAIATNGTVYVWGRNDNGQLGLAHNRSPWVPEQLCGYRAVHPDRTLRKNKRSCPRTRVIAVPSGSSSSGSGSDGGGDGFKGKAKGKEGNGEAKPESKGDDTGGSGGGNNSDGKAPLPTAS